MKSKIAWIKSGTLAKLPRRTALPLSSANQRSTKLSQLELVMACIHASAAGAPWKNDFGSRAAGIDPPAKSKSWKDRPKDHAAIPDWICPERLSFDECSSFAGTHRALPGPCLAPPECLQPFHNSFAKLERDGLGPIVTVDYSTRRCHGVPDRSSKLCG
jgi:hypothetical protein